MTTRVLYISYDGMTDPLGQSQVMPYLIGLTKKGYVFTLISCEKEDAFKKNKTTIQNILDVNHIEWHPVSYTKNPPVLSAIFDLYKIQKLAFRLQEEKGFSIIHCRSYIAAMVGLQMKKKLNIKFIFDMRGLWADERVDGKLWNLKNPVYKSVYQYFKKKEKDFLETADHTISLTYSAKNEILSWKNIDGNPVPVEVIPCCADLDLFNKKNSSPDKIRALKNELKIAAGDFILLYLGSIGTWYLLDEMMEFFSVLKKQKPSARFLFVTKDEHARILEAARKFNLEDAIILRAAAREEVPLLISLSDYSVFFILPSYSKIASSPTKQGEIMAMGIPVVCNAGVGDTDKIIRDYNSGVVVNGFSVSEYQRAVSKMEHTWSADEIIAGATDYFSLEKGVEKYAAVYRSVLAD